VTAAGFAGAVGGADIVTTAPLTQALGQPTPFARRIARNTQLLLLEESNLARVADPAAGAWGVEALTDELARGAWALFQDIEKRGGLAASFEWFAGDVAKVRAARIANVRRRKDEITGVSAFPLVGEQPVAAERWAHAESPRKGLPKMRLAEPFEALRDAAERAGQPAIYLATLGAPAQFSARENFAKGLFEAGGIKAVGGEIDHQPASLGAAFTASGAKAACLCGPDGAYAAQAEAAARALKRAGCQFLVLAGKPGDNEQALRAAGVDGFAFAGADAVEFLEQTHAALGIGR
jgi:methylmalonyl-CoA mutase